MSVAVFRPGRVFSGDYRIVRPLASGGMGTVYVAEQLSTGRERALKLLNPEIANDPKTRERFEQEARVASRIRSEHVVEVLAAGFDEESGTPWLAMELLDGIDLSALVASHGALAPSDVREILAQLCDALIAAHEANVVHRDLKPENVFLARPKLESTRFVVKILDFGIAKIVEEASANAVTTSVLGTPRWMAPEQTKEGGAVTPASDVWTLGLLTFHLLTAHYYWKQARGGNGSSVVALLREILFEPIAPASERAAEMGLGHLIPEGFDAWLSCCLDRNPALRFRNAGLAWAALEPLLARPSLFATGDVSRPRPLAAFPERAPSNHDAATPHVAVPIPRAAPSRAKVWLLVALGVLVLAAATLAVVLNWPTPPAPPKRTESAVDLTGTYSIGASQNPGQRGSYNGSVMMTRAGESYRLVWSFASRPADEGIGLHDGRTLGVAWGCVSGCFVTVYQISGRKLRGRSVSGDSPNVIRTEELEGPPSLNGTFTIVQGPSGSTGTVSIVPKGETYALTWTTNRGAFYGVGLRHRNTLVVASTVAGRSVGVVSYDVSSAKRLVGRWGRLNDSQTGTETLLRH